MGVSTPTNSLFLGDQTTDGVPNRLKSWFIDFFEATHLSMISFDRQGFFLGDVHSRRVPGDNLKKEKKSGLEIKQDLANELSGGLNYQSDACDLVLLVEALDRITCTSNKSDKVLRDVYQCLIVTRQA